MQKQRLALAFISSQLNAGQHKGEVISTIASQQGPGFESTFYPGPLCMKFVPASLDYH